MDKMVNGQLVQMTPEEEAEFTARKARKDAEMAPKVLLKNKRLAARESIKTAKSVQELRQAVMDLLEIE